MAKSVIKFDTDGIATCGQEYRSYAEETEQIIKDLQSALDDLISKDWQGKAADAFNKSFGSEWKIYAERYSELIDHIADLFEEISAAYQEVERQAKSLKYPG